MSRTPEQIRDEWLHDLMPPGALERDTQSNLAKFLLAFAGPLATLEGDIAGLDREIAPGTAVGLLADYEAVLGPARCDTVPDSSTLAQRQAIAQARWTARGVVSRQDFIDFAAALGYSITVTEFVPARFGRAQFGTPYYGRDWAFFWQINCASVRINVAQFGQSRFGDPYRSWDGQILICQLTARAPAHTKLQFNWTGGMPSWLDQFVLDANTLG